MTLSSFLQIVFSPLAVTLVAMIPAFLVGWVLLRKKKAYEAEASEPFTSLPLRPPGESLRLKIDELRDKFDEELTIIFLAGFAAAVVTIVTPAGHRLAVGGASLVFAFGVAAWRARKLFSVARLLWDYRLGFMGERVVGEELNQLLAFGFRVFHDVPFENFNVDHVLVGPPGVYVVETKAWRKPSHIRGNERATIVFDGECVRSAKGTDRDAIQQVRRNVVTMSEWLSSATGEKVTAKGILTFPGWWVEKNEFKDVRVMNPDLIQFHFRDHPRRNLSADSIQRIAHQLTERCRLRKEAK